MRRHTVLVLTAQDTSALVRHGLAHECQSRDRDCTTLVLCLDPASCPEPLHLCCECARLRVIAEPAK